MNVIFDYQIFAEHEYGGISRYFRALAEELCALPSIRAKILSPLYVNRYVRSAPADLIAGAYVRPGRGRRRLILATSGLAFRASLPFFRPDIVHETYYAGRPATYPSRVRRVLTVFDMIHERCAQDFDSAEQFSAAKAKAIQRADHLFCISECTKRDLMDILGVPASKITVTYLAADPLPLPQYAASELTGVSPYLLYVGGRGGYKNFDNLLKAYAASSWLHENFRLVCFGGGRFSQEELQAFVDLGLSAGQVVHVGGEDEVAAALYRGAAAFIYPSRYEGFGIPLLEAMSLDCPVICSSAASIPEVVGTAGAYFDSHQVDSIRDVLESTLQSRDTLTKLVETGRRQRTLFSWSRCAAETHKIYQELMK
ncbi:glycosyltransferase family 4 protein [Curvibacter sp. CHRR-16]|uniref:glycosyltransferase family 4 protein n=1 Tax=Curvibacter sp. CHRR-16 TaxID=2835872 RepID=UPI001BDA3AF0|nr:glycosyltransferase family 1 protein [Curvibacter sp. CHRR-16]MBT0571748.1 glycosyltransferase family 4 protein [Curvibacter sp. CHRR-16]